MPKLGASLTDKERAKVTSGHADIDCDDAGGDDQDEEHEDDGDDAEEQDEITPTTMETGSFIYCIRCNLKSNISIHILL
jgi:hypothetical protein